MCNLRNITINLGLLKRMKKVKVTSIFNRIGQKNSVLVEVSGFEKVFLIVTFLIIVVIGVIMASSKENNSSLYECN